MHFGTMLWVCQMMLGYGDPKHKEDDFLNVESGDLWDFFGEIELPNGMLGLELFADRDWHTTALCQIDTTLPYSMPITRQQFLNLIEDLKEYVRSLPLAKCGDDALVVDPRDPRYYEASNQAWLREVNALNHMLDATFAAAKEKLRRQGIVVLDSADKQEDEIPF